MPERFGEMTVERFNDNFVYGNGVGRWNNTNCVGRGLYEKSQGPLTPWSRGCQSGWKYEVFGLSSSSSSA